MVNFKVRVISRFAKWKIGYVGHSTYLRSEPFKVGLWNWILILDKGRNYHSISLSLQPPKLSTKQPPIASFIFRISDYESNNKPCVSNAYERHFQNSEDFVWSVNDDFHGGLVINVEFLDLKIVPHIGGEAKSIWFVDGIEYISSQTTLKRLSRLFSEAIHADVTIIMADGTLSAHKAILSASSQVFQNMFHHDFKEKESSTIQIEDMSLEIGTVLLNYLYGSIKQEDFWKHRVSLLGVANKYVITDLKNACEESLMDDINPDNVLERLQDAWLYQLDKLKKRCMTKLCNLAKVHDFKDAIRNFCMYADRELLGEILLEMFSIQRLS